MKRNSYIIIVAILVFALLTLGIIFANIDNEKTKDSVKSSNYTNYTYEIVVENLDTPWAIGFLPDGRMIFNERRGKVSILDAGNVEAVGNIQVSEISESGLLGIAVDPKFSINYFVYLYYTSSSGFNRVSQFVFDEKTGLKNEVVLLDNIPSAKFHDGGRIKFGPDGELYITTGDATEPSSAQDINSLAGKILRMNKDGSIPSDNPFGNYVYSYGHRNPQGIDWDKKGNMFAVEHGPTSNDEINIIEKGKNYGWPIKCSDQSGIDNVLPLRCYESFTLAPSAIAVVGDNLYVTGLRGEQLRKIVIDENNNIVSEEVLIDDLGRLRDVVKQDGYLYIATSNRDGRGIPKVGDDKILRVKL